VTIALRDLTTPPPFKLIDINNTNSHQPHYTLPWFSRIIPPEPHRDIRDPRCCKPTSHPSIAAVAFGCLSCRRVTYSARVHAHTAAEKRSTLGHGSELWVPGFAPEYGRIAEFVLWWCCNVALWRSSYACGSLFEAGSAPHECPTHLFVLVTVGCCRRMGGEVLWALFGTG
jgi:hypothetical protein